MPSLHDHPEFRRVLDASSEGAFAVSPDRRILFLNARARNLLGYEPGETLDLPCHEKIQGTECSANCLLKRALEGQEDVRDVDMWLRTKDGHQIYARTHLILLRGEGGAPAAALHLFSDVSRVLHLRGEAVDERFVFTGIIGRNEAMQEVFRSIQLVAETASTVLITGESGTGKELVAAAVHHHSGRRERPFVKLNCAALNEGVLESELFGHVKGAFTGALGDKIGRFELASGGTLFLDEIGDISPATQVKLLRVLQEGELERVGSSRTMRVDVRVLAATNKDLRAAMDRGEFRQDLFYRLNVFHIELPPLRDRKEDIPLLVDHFLEKVSAKMPGRELQGIEAGAMTLLMNYDFPGNIRELENLIEHAAIRCQGGVIRPADLPLSAAGAPPLPTPLTLHQIRTPLETLERDHIAKTLEGSAWRIARTAQKLGVSRVTLWRKMKEYGIQKPDQP